MAVRLIAVDMDGTFLNDRMGYDERLFGRLHQVMRERRIHFVVASGNQYYQLRSFFPDADDVIYVAENGALVIDARKTYFVSVFGRHEVRRILECVRGHRDVEYVVCGRRSAYLPFAGEDAFRADMQRYYHRLRRLEDGEDVPDEVLKFALSCLAGETPRLVRELADDLAGVAQPVSSGHGSIDLIKPGVHKANALRVLGDALGVVPRDMVAFGDGGNDVEMLRFVGRGLAMANAPDVVREQADEVIASNNDQGVLRSLERLLGAEPS